MSYKKLILIFLFSSFFYGSIFSQIDLLLKKDTISIVEVMSANITSTIKRLNEKPKIKNEPITQPFCSLSLGRNETLFFKKNAIQISTRKSFFGKKNKCRNQQRIKKYYRNCFPSNVLLNNNGNIQINSVSLSKFSKSLIDDQLPSSFKKLAPNLYKVGTLYLLFQFNKKGKVTIIQINRNNSAANNPSYLN